ncbi:hypothetical protein LINPERPRIM_LOCUS25143 [Linum perenne]
MATGEDAVQPGDAASRVQSRAACSYFMEISTEQVDSYTIPSNMDRNSVMEDLINQGKLVLKRQCLYEELSNFPELSSYQRTKAMRHLYRDDGDASTYFHLRTPEEKLAFVWTILE